MVVYQNNTLCLIRSIAIESGFTNTHQWDNWIKSGATLVKRGLVAVDSLPPEVKISLPSPEQTAVKNTFMEHVCADEKAVTFYSNYLLADGRELGAIENGRYLKDYSINANVLNAVDKIFTNQALTRKAYGTKARGFWPKTADVLNDCRAELAHSLPANFERLRSTYLKYKAEGYEALISKKFCNDNTLKVTADMERLLMSIYTMPNKPFSFDVYTTYVQFITGKIQIVDKNTGEVFEPSHFVDKKGNPIVISKETVWNWLNKPANRAVVDSKRSGQFQFNNMHRPHHVRKAAEYSFSKISMDDRDLPRKSTEQMRVKAYYAYDVASGCVVGASYSRSKDEQLFVECLRNMFRLIENNDLPMPLEVEVENHLVNKFFDELAIMFPYVRICNPGNSQEKRAEHFNRAKKYGVEKKTQNGIGRWWAKSEAYRVDVSKVNDEFVEKLFTYDRLVADDMASVRDYNNQLHPKQKKYPGKTRWQVLCENVNPFSPKVSKPVVYKSIGECTNTTIRRNQYVTVQYAKYALPNPHIIDKLEPNNYNVQAYYMADTSGNISEVYLYQSGSYLCKCERINEYSEAKAEWLTGVDDVNYAAQAKYVSQFDAKIRKGKHELAKVEITPTETTEAIAAATPVIIETKPLEIETIEDILNDYDPNEYINKSKNNI